MQEGINIRARTQSCCEFWKRVTMGTEESSFIPKASLNTLVSQLGFVTLGASVILVFCGNCLLDLW